MKNAKYERDASPIDPECDCPVCRRYSKAYLHHLFKAEEMLAMRLSVMHNLYFYNKLTGRIREALDTDTFDDFRREYSEKLSRRIWTVTILQIVHWNLSRLSWNVPKMPI